MLEIAALGVGLMLLLRGGTPRGEAPKPTESGEKLTKEQLAEMGAVDPLGMGLTPSVNKAIEIGSTVGKGAAALGGLGASIAVAAGATGPVGLVAAGAATVVGAGAGTGFLMTQDIGGAVAGAAVGPGTLFNVGRTLGRELDKVFGGDGANTSGSSVVAQIAWGVALVSVFVFAPLALVLSPIALLAQGIASLVSDENRKARGQNGAEMDLNELVTKVFGDTYSNYLVAGKKYVAEKYKRDLKPEEDARIRAHAGIVTLGYALVLNAIHKRMWMMRPHGLGVTDDGHLAWGLARDYWVENEAAVRDWVMHLISPTGNSKNGEALVALVQRESPAQAEGLLQLGYWQANAQEYLAHMADGWGVGQGAKNHALYGRDKIGRFAGEIANDGDMRHKNVWLYWEASQRLGYAVKSGELGGY